MDFNLTEEQHAIFDMAESFGQEKIAPNALAWDEAGELPREILTESAALGFATLYVPEDLGGTGLSRLDATLVFEALSMACPSVASFITIHNMCANMIAQNGTAEMRDYWMPRLSSMETIVSYCLTEPGSGSDASALRTRAARTNEG